MDRRNFIGKSLLGTMALSGLTKLGAKAANADDSTTKPAKPLTVRDVQNHLRGMGAKWIPIDSKRTVDTIHAGDPDAQVTRIAVAWNGYLETLKKVHEEGYDLIVVHEPPYYCLRNTKPTGFALEGANRKKKFLEESKLALIRCHDVWDRVAEIGICDSWAKLLGLEKEINRPANFDPTAARPFHVAYEIEPVRAGDFAATVAAKVAIHDHKNVMLVGPEDKIVRSVAIGTGAITRFNQMVTELRPDLTLCSDDGFTFWRDGTLAIDMEYPVVIASHSSAEEFGMKQMADHLAKTFPQVLVRHIPEKAMYQQIGPKS
ncbi:MAG: Nif3-like dinuclear metal center hexameric protein [Pirellulales bacterium]|nr:Nif3-like dinuclear metal center hexameric protein [Pirellulales bacterium]